jgi:predicted nuclease with TOPRIM domain
MSENFLEEEKLIHYQNERARILFRFGNLKEAIQVASHLEWKDVEKRKEWGEDVKHLEGAYYNSAAIKDCVCSYAPIDNYMYEGHLRRIKCIEEMFDFMEEILMRRGYEHCFYPWSLCMTEYGISVPSVSTATKFI